MSEYVPGQRWVNDAGLQLGLGLVTDCDERTVTVVFPATDESFTYAQQSAPLTRVKFSSGEQIQLADGQKLNIQTVEDIDGLLFYSGTDSNGNKTVIPETRIANKLSLTGPLQRLINGQIDKNKDYELRYLSLDNQTKLSHSSMRGMNGCRTSLLPHQLYIAHEVSQRFAPRVLLADEVGLGKTIEAGLIIHQQLLTERISRVLIIVPETLLHQWLVEMLRRFNLKFSIFDDARVEALIEEGHSNPFETEQLVLCSLSFLQQYPEYYQQCLNAEWDMLVVDEAHHLEWHNDEPSLEYQMVEQLALNTEGVLLLTATPEQLGKYGHFARLRLLDTDRFSDYESFTEEEKDYIQIAELVDALLYKDQLGENEKNKIAKILAADGQLDLQRSLDKVEQQDEIRNAIISHLLDRHGTGRIMFRNSRNAIKGFPQRKLHAYPLLVPEHYQVDEFTSIQQSLHPETTVSIAGAWVNKDPRIQWLIEKLQQLSQTKVLVIVSSADSATGIMQALRKKTSMQAAVFVEGMTLVERDRAAAFFADADEGSQVLVCSEIGSEGRNFQFAHHIVLFDLPLNPDLLEQRIGRLDRIGQTETINIHVPYFKDTAQEVLFRWYHEGLAAFEKHSPATLTVYKEVFPELEIALQGNTSELAGLIKTTSQRHAELEQLMHDGRDRLLEYNSCRTDIASKLSHKAEHQQRIDSLVQFVELFCDVYGIQTDIQSNQRMILKPGEYMLQAMTELPEDGITVTFNREIALANENISYLTWDHPLTLSMLDNILSSEIGNTSVISMKHKGIRPGTLLCEYYFVVEASANKKFKISRYLPATGIRLLLSEQGKNYTNSVSHLYIEKNHELVDLVTARQIVNAKLKEIKQLSKHADKIAQQSSQDVLKAAREKSHHMLETEINRLLDLQKINPNVRDSEIDFFKHELTTVEELIASANIRLNALRLLVCT